MLRKLVTVLTALIFISPLHAQRRVEKISNVIPAISFKSVILDDQLVWIPYLSTRLYRYNGLSLSSYAYPSSGGTLLRTRGDVFVHDSKVYLNLFNSSGTDFLYTYNGGSFSRVTVPGEIVSNAVEYRDEVYVLSRVGLTIKLYKCTGIISEVSGISLPDRPSYKLQVAGIYLYLSAFSVSPGTFAIPHILQRYNGTVATTLPIINFPNGISRIFHTSTAVVYFQVASSQIIYFNGSSVFRTYTDPLIFLTSTLYHDQLFVIRVDMLGMRGTTLFRITGGGDPVPVALPSGYSIFPFADMVVFEDQLYFFVTGSSGGVEIFRFDGTTMFPVLNIPPPINWNLVKLTKREGNLIIHAGRAFEYSGSFTEILPPSAHSLFPYLASNSCNHFWGLGDTLDFGIGTKAIGKEAKSCPPPPPPSPVPVIPEYLKDYVRFDMTWSAESNRECWSELIVNWVPTPVCPLPPCPIPNFQVQFTDDNNQIGWEQIFSQPFTVNIPLGDQTPFKSIFSAIADKSLPLFILESNLVEKGISKIRISMEPSSNKFSFGADTRPNIIVPLKIEMLNLNGTIAWTQAFTAPFTQEITSTIPAYGQTLRFSIPGPAEQMMAENITSVDFYPNPSPGKAWLEVKTRRQNIRSEITIVSMQGTVLYKKTVILPVLQNLDLQQIKPGIYFLFIKTAEEESKKLIYLN